MRKALVLTVILGFVAVVVLFGAIQLIPVNRDNPPVVTQVRWDSQQTQALFQRACADCHSNETVWPTYAYIAPISWLVVRDVQEGRERFNISDLRAGGGEGREGREGNSGEDIQEVILEGSMPMSSYIMLHPSAKLTQEERQALANGLTNTLNATRLGQ
jgi:mono/diheme cytochrome c family protein